MSGSSFNYLCDEDFQAETFMLSEMAEQLDEYGYADVALRVRAMLHAIEGHNLIMAKLADELHEVFHAVEWHVSGDTGMDDVVQAVLDWRSKNA